MNLKGFRDIHITICLPNVVTTSIRSNVNLLLRFPVAGGSRCGFGFTGPQSGDVFGVPFVPQVLERIDLLGVVGGEIVLFGGIFMFTFSVMGIF